MKQFALLFLLATSVLSHGASVLWNDGFRLFKGSVEENRTGWWLRLSYEDKHDIYFDLLMEIEKSGSGDGRMLYASTVDVGRESWFILAGAGEEINAESSKEESRLFLTNVNWSGNARLEYEAEDDPKTFYLGFETTDCGLWTESDGWITPERKIYGWVELVVDDFAMTLGDTCLDLAGRPIVAGAVPAEPIPEPSSWVLATLGAAAILRRHRFHCMP